MPQHNRIRPSGADEHRWHVADKRTKCVKKNKSAIPRDYFDVTAMIRSLQRTEGKIDCFRRGQIDCDQTDCPWRAYCLDP